MSSQRASEDPVRLREQVEAARRLVEAAEEQYELRRPFRGQSATAVRNSFPGYTIQRELHHGGQGVVYLASQASTQRDVAIKVLREGLFASQHDKARFEREVHLLGQLTHPNIVTILDSGSTAGHCYLVMDYIDGRSLDTYLADEELSTDDTLKLFVKICDPVSAAHLRGVIHRDIKPSNIQVDESASPHILDFGLATMAEPEAWNSLPALTITGHFLGSLPWASPEQVAGASQAIDLRTDIYSLGVVLYHMLTGRFPYPVVGRMSDVLDNIQSAVPERPSSTGVRIHRDIETIVLKCLNKNPSDRYQSATELAVDIERYLRLEPIFARPPSIPYLLGKFVRRKRTAVAVTAALALTSIAAAASLISESVANKIAYADQRANAAADVARIFGERMAMALPTRAVSVLDILYDQAHLPVSEQPSWLQSASEELRNDPLFLAHREEEFARLYGSAGAYCAAAGRFKNALEYRQQSAAEMFMLRTPNLLGDMLRRCGECDEAESLALHWHEFCLSQFGTDNEHTVRFQVNLADALGCQGRIQEAEMLYRTVIVAQEKFQNDSHPDKADTHARLAECLIEQRRHGEAAASAKTAYFMHDAAQGKTNPATLRAQLLLGEALLELGRWDDAEGQLEQVVRLCDTPQMHASKTAHRASELLDRLHEKRND